MCTHLLCTNLDPAKPWRQLLSSQRRTAAQLAQETKSIVRFLHYSLQTSPSLVDVFLSVTMQSEPLRRSCWEVHALLCWLLCCHLHPGMSGWGGLIPRLRWPHSQVELASFPGLHPAFYACNMMSRSLGVKLVSSLVINRNYPFYSQALSYLRKWTWVQL